MGTVSISVAADGTNIAEADLRDGGLEDAVADSRRLGANVLHAAGDGWGSFRVELPATRDPELLHHLYG